MVLVLKTSEPERVPWVRIPPLPRHGAHGVTVNMLDCDSIDSGSIPDELPKINEYEKEI